MAYIKVEEVAAIRAALKAEFGKKFKFGVARRHGSEVAVTIKSGTVDFGKIESVNHYHITKENYGEHVDTFNKIVEIICKAPGTVEGGREYFDESDSQSDYFHCAFYFNIHIGSWDKPYVKVAA